MEEAAKQAGSEAGGQDELKDKRRARERAVNGKDDYLSIRSVICGD